VKFFVNGRLVASRSFTQPPLSVAANTCLGEMALGAGMVAAPLHGRLDEVRVYGRALAAAEIQQLYLTDTGSVRLLGVNLLAGGEVQVIFEAPALPSTHFAIESADALGGVTAWLQEPRQGINRTALGTFDARVPFRSSSRFYRVLSNNW
jgi:type IV secretory pathway TrbL component